MAVTYRIIQIEEQSPGVYYLNFQVEYMMKVKMFSCTLTTTSTTQAQICTEGWALIKDDVQVFITQVTNGTWLQGSSFVPQDDGTLIF